MTSNVLAATVLDVVEATSSVTEHTPGPSAAEPALLTHAAKMLASVLMVATGMVPSPAEVVGDKVPVLGSRN